jgi:hypothetical protein
MPTTDIKFSRVSEGCRICEQCRRGTNSGLGVQPLGHPDGANIISLAYVTWNTRQTGDTRVCTHVHACLCVYVCVCWYVVCMHICMNCMCVQKCMCMHICITWADMILCMGIGMYVSVHVWGFVHTCIGAQCLLPFWGRQAMAHQAGLEGGKPSQVWVSAGQDYSKQCVGGGVMNNTWEQLRRTGSTY